MGGKGRRKNALQAPVQNHIHAVDCVPEGMKGDLLLNGTDGSLE